MTKTVRLGSKRQIAISKTLCEKLGIHIGQNLTIAVAHGHLILFPLKKSYSKALEGLGRNIWKGIDPLDYIWNERAAWKTQRSRLS